MRHTSEIQRLLFRSDDRAKALFSSQSELAQAITEVDSTYKNVRSTAIFLSDLFVGKKRRFPMPLHDALKTVTEARMEAKGWDRIERNALRLAIMRLGVSGVLPETVDFLLARQRAAEEIVITTPFPLEVQKHPRSADFLEALVDAMEDRGRYIFVLPEKENFGFFQVFWMAILEELVRRNPAIQRSEHEQQLAQLNKTGRLTVCAAQPELCLIPTVFFDPSLDWKFDGYCWSWHVNERHEVVDEIALFNRDVTGSKWQRDFYRGVLHGPKPLPERRFEDYITTRS